VVYTVKMEFPRPDLRYARSREAMLQAAIELAQETDIDEISVSQVVKKASVSRPTFYTHFEDVDGLLAEVWLWKHREWVMSLCDPGDFEVYEKPESVALLQILLGAPRKPQVLEIVRVSLTNLFDAHLLSVGERAIAFWTVSNRLGVIATRKQWPKANDAAFLDGYLNAISTSLVIKTDFEYSDLDPVPSEKPQNIDSSLIHATIEIVQASGVRGLSINRLGRVLGATSAYIYPRITSLTALVGESFDFALKDATRGNFKLWDGGLSRKGIEGFATYIVGGLADQRNNWRLFRREVILTSIHDRELADAVSGSLDDFLREVTGKASFLPVPKEIPERLGVLVHTLLFGFSSLFAVGITVRNLPHADVIRAMFAELGKRVVRGKKLF